jgi:hypothetical protein
VTFTDHGNFNKTLWVSVEYGPEAWAWRAAPKYVLNIRAQFLELANSNMSPELEDMYRDVGLACLEGFAGDARRLLDRESEDGVEIGLA